MTNTKVLTDALQKIAAWELPETGKFWDEEKKEPMSYGAAYGSNGERDYMKKVATAALASYAAPSDMADRNPYRLDWPKHFPIMSNIRDRTGIAIEWQMVWSEVEGWYGDIKKKETGEEFLKRLQSQFLLTERKPEGQVTGKSAVPDDRDEIRALAFRNFSWVLNWLKKKDIHGADKDVLIRGLEKAFDQLQQTPPPSPDDGPIIVRSGEAGKQPEQQPADWTPLRYMEYVLHEYFKWEAYPNDVAESRAKEYASKFHSWLQNKQEGENDSE